MYFVCYDVFNTVDEVLYVASNHTTYRFHIENEDTRVAWEPTAFTLKDFHQCLKFKTIDAMMDWNYKVPGAIKSSLVEDVYSYYDRGLPT